MQLTVENCGEAIEGLRITLCDSVCDIYLSHSHMFLARPEITVMVDCALKIEYLYQKQNRNFRFLIEMRNRVFKGDSPHSSAGFLP